MPLARIEIEQIEATRWVAEVEIGGFMSKRTRVTGDDYQGIMGAVIEAYDGLLSQQMPRPKPESAAVEPPAEGLLPGPEVEAVPAADAIVDERLPLVATPRRGRPPIRR